MKINISVLIISSLLLSSCGSFFRAIHYSPSQKMEKISFTNDPPNKHYHFYYSDTLNNTYLTTIRQDYPIKELASSKTEEIEKIKAILNWSSSQWEHNGSNTPSKSDALTILSEAEEGKQFRCVEYGILASACLNSMGIKSRVLGLKTRDVEKVKFGAGHVVAETYSTQFDKWIFIDPQFNIMPTLEGMPLNAVEFQNAIMTQKNEIVLVNSAGIVNKEHSDSYIKWIGKYLYFFDVLFDQRVGADIDYKSFNGKTKLMLVPVGVENPTVFQRKHKMNFYFYTNSITDFYRNPGE